MRLQHHPQRLGNLVEYREWVEAVALPELDEERLARNKAAILTRLEEIDRAGSARASNLHPGRPVLALRVAVVLGLSLIAAIAGALLISGVLGRRSPPEISPSLGRTPGNSAVPPSPSRRSPDRLPSPPESDREPGGAPVETLGPKPAPSPAGALAQASPEPALSAAVGEERPGASSTLPEQLRLYREAEEASVRGEFDKALVCLAALEEKYPQTPLGSEVALTRVELLYRAGRFAAVAAEIPRLLDRPEMAGKKAVLLALLGNVYLKQGNCPQAREAFERALSLGLDGERALSVQAALRSCR